jgi:hypothetical protein
MPRQQTIKTEWIAILRPEFQHLVPVIMPVIREIAVAASFVRRQASLLINVYLNKENAILPTYKTSKEMKEYGQSTSPEQST